jgi:hypothetical protein
MAVIIHLKSSINDWKYIYNTKDGVFVAFTYKSIDSRHRVN